MIDGEGFVFPFALVCFIDFIQMGKDGKRGFPVLPEQISQFGVLTKNTGFHAVPFPAWVTWQITYSFLGLCNNLCSMNIRCYYYFPCKASLTESFLIIL